MLDAIRETARSKDCFESSSLMTRATDLADGGLVLYTSISAVR